MDQTDGGDEGGNEDETDYGPGDPGSSNIKLNTKKMGKRTSRKNYSTKPQDFQVFILKNIF